MLFSSHESWPGIQQHCFFPKASEMLGFSFIGDYARSEIEVDDPVGRCGTGGGRAGAAEIAWEEARDGGARSKGMIRPSRRVVDGLKLQK